MKLGTYWKGAWPYSHSEGVGLKLTGKPRNEGELRQFLYSMSCNPVATERIIKELHATGTKLTTVQASLNIAYIGDELGRLGIKMEVIAPVETEKLNDGVVDAVALALILGRTPCPHLTPEQEQEARRRAEEVGHLDAAALGPYSPR